MGIVEEVGPRRQRPAASATASSCRSTSAAAPAGCATRGLYSQCETTQNHEHGTGASFFGYSKLYGQVPGGQAEYLRVPFADFLPIKVPHGPPDDRFLFLSDVLPTAWQAVRVRRRRGRRDAAGRSAPARSATWRPGSRCTAGHRVIVVDACPSGSPASRRAAPRRSTSTARCDGVGDAVRELTGGRGADAVIDAVGMEAHGSPVAEAVQKLVGLLPEAGRTSR